MAAARVPQGYSSRQEWAKAQGMALPVIGQPSATTQDSGSFGSFTPVIFDNVTKPMRRGPARPSIQDIEKANDEFSNEGISADYYKGLDEEFYNRYKTLWTELDAKGDEQGKIALNNKFDSLKELEKKFNKDYALTFDGQEAEGARNLMDSVYTEEWTMEDLRSNRPLLESIQLTNGAYNIDGTVKTKDELLQEWVRDQQLIEYNLGKKGIEAVKLANLSTMEQDAMAIQWLTFQKTKGWMEEGGISGKETLENISLAIATDPVNLIGGVVVRGIIKGAGKVFKKDIEGEVVKKGMSLWLANHLKTKAALKTGGVSSVWGATFMAADTLSDQNIKIKGDLQKEFDFKEVGINTLVGAVTGFGLGLGIHGGVQVVSKTLSNKANKWRIQQGLDDQQFIDEIGKAVKDKESLKLFLKTIGWDRKSVKAEVKKLKVEKDAYVTPTVVRNSEDSIIGRSPHDDFAPIEGGPVVPKAVEKLAAEKLIPKPKTKTEAAKNEQILKARERVKKQEKVEDVLNEDYIPVDKTLLPRFNKWGYNTYRYINDKIGSGIARTVYGPDMQLIYSGGRKLGESMYGANVAIDMNLARINGKISQFFNKHKKELGNVNKLIENGVKAEGVTPIQKQFINMILKDKKNIITDAYKAKVITKTDYNKYMKDDSYIPRVWNSAYLTTTQGAKEFSTYLQTILKKNPASAKKLIRHITGETKYADDFLKGPMNARDIKRLWHFNAIERTNISRSSHLEKARKFVLPARMERDLDPFMAPGEERWAMFFADTIRRNEYAKRFGANDEKVTKFVNKMRKDAKTERNPAKLKSAKDIEEVYFTAVGDPARSATVAQTIEQAVAGKAIAKINAFQNWKLGLAAIPNSTQGFVNGTTLLAKNTNILTLPYKAISALVRATVRTEKSKEIVRRAGVLGDMDMAKIATENSPHARILDREFGKYSPLRILNEPTLFLRSVGFIPVERWNRSGGAIFGYAHINDLNSRLQKLVAKGEINSIKSLKYQKQMKELGVLDPLKGELTANDIAIASHMFNKKINFSGESAVLPINWHKPWFKLATKFKSFMFYQARFIKREVADELFIHHNAKPLLTYMAAAGIAGNVIEQVRGVLTAKEIESNRGPLKLLIDGIGHAGSWGLWFQTMKDVSERGAGALATIAGPTVADAFDTVQDISKADFDNIILRILPNIPGKGQLKNEWRDE
jgi:hypothetical protein